MGTMSTKRQAMILAYCATLALSVAGCGGGSKSSNPATPPTAGLSSTVAMPWAASVAPGPMPDSCRSWGEFTVPPDTITSRSARA